MNRNDLRAALHDLRQVAMYCGDPRTKADARDDADQLRAGAEPGRDYLDALRRAARGFEEHFRLRPGTARWALDTHMAACGARPMPRRPPEPTLPRLADFVSPEREAHDSKRRRA